MDYLFIIALFLCFKDLASEVTKTQVRVRVLVPPMVRRGSTVTLLCLHNVPPDELYSVKWYRGSYEFYRFVPRVRPPTLTFPLPGLEVDMNGSSGQQVTVRVLERHLSGRFTCEVSAEEPEFSTSTDSANLTVVEMGLRRPLLVAASSVHVSGTPLQINCSAQPTVPPPHISFFIDDVKVDRRLVRGVAPGLATMEVLQLSPQDGPHWVGCEATVPGVYQMTSASIPILEQPPRQASSNSLAHKPAHCSCLMALFLLILVRYKIMFNV